MASQLQLTFYRPARPLVYIPPPSVKLRQARDLLRNLLLIESLLTESVADRLESLAAKLDDLSWKQEMWENCKL